MSVSNNTLDYSLSKPFGLCDNDKTPVIFENHVEYSDRVFKELAKKALSKWATKKISIVFYAFIIVTFTLLFITRAISLLVYIPVLVIAALPAIAYVIQLKMLRNSYKGVQDRRIVVKISDKIYAYSKQANEKEVFEFDTIIYAQKTKEYTLLKTNPKSWLVLDNQGFTVGTVEEFIVFLQSKGISIKK